MNTVSGSGPRAGCKLPGRPSWGWIGVIKTPLFEMQCFLPYPTLPCTIPFLQTENKAFYPLDKGKNFLDHRRLIANNKNEICRSSTSTRMN